MATAEDPARAASLLRILSSAGNPGITGHLINAPWDNWDNPAWCTALADDPALARVRRIDNQQFRAVPDDH